MKKMLAVLVVLAVAAAVAFFTLNNPLGRLVKLAIEGFGPDMVQAKVSVRSVDISASDGHGKLVGFLIGNPKGFKTSHALRADTIEIVVEPASLTKDVVVLHKILIDAPNISYEKNDKGSNFDAIQHNVEAYLKTSGKKNDDKGAATKMIIDSLVIRNAQVNYNGTIDLSLPDIELRNVGKNSGGVTSAQLTKLIITELNSKIALELVKVGAIGIVGGAAIGAGMAIKGLLDK
jgi:hypothetical protein